MIAAIGTDIVDTRRIARSLARYGDRFERRILADAELRPALTGAARAAYLARQFCAKEAVAKVLGTGMKAGVHFRQILILRSDSGAPVVRLESHARRRADHLGLSVIHISLSDEKDYAIAFAVAESAGNAPG